MAIKNILFALGGFIKASLNMCKALTLVLMLTAFMPFAGKTEWVSLDRNKPSGTPPEVTLISDDASCTVIRVELYGFEIRDVLMTDGKKYQAVDMLSEIFTTQPGFPELPYLAKILAVPDQAGLSVEVLQTGEIRTFSDVYLPPARESAWEGNPEPPFTENPEAYLTDQVYPGSATTIEPPSVYRDFRIARVTLFPMQYIAAKRELKVATSLTIRVNYGPGEVINPKLSKKRQIAPSYGKLYRGAIFNYRQVLDRLYDGKEDGREFMLCIMPDALAPYFQVYADWKRQSGTDIHVTKFSDIGANATNPDIIRNHVSDAYFNWQYPPTNVLIVGDNGIFPKKTVSYPSYTFPWEEYFVAVDGSDFFPDMMIGRFTNEAEYRMQVMMNKYMLYEQHPYNDNTTWFKKGVVCSNNNYQSQIDTKRFAANMMMNEGGFISVDTLMSDGWGSYDCTVGLDDIVWAINNGRSYLNYRGEGWSYGWFANCYDFYTDDVSSLNNGQKFTFVTSIGCGVAMFNASGGNCFGEEWIEMGTLTSPRGGIGFLGPTSNTHTTFNNKIDKGIYVGMFAEGMDTPGQALQRGKLYMYNVYGTDPYVEYHYKVYCVLGDPNIHIWKEFPNSIQVSHPDVINVGNNHLEFGVTFAASGQPAPGAQLCLAGNEVFITGVSDSTGKVIVDFAPVVQDTLVVTVRGGNIYPYQDTILVVQPPELVEPENNPVIVDLDGNLDGKMNPNEMCTITFTLKNWGSQTAANVQATLLAEDPNYIQVVTTNQVAFGDLAPGASYTGDPFQFFIKPNCQVGQIVTLKLHVSTTNYSWDHYLDEEIRGCRLEYRQFLVKDEGAPNLNYRLDPGETAMLVVSIENTGDDAAPDVMGILSSNDPYVTVTDGYGLFATIDTASLATNANNCFVIEVDPSCPIGHWINFSLALSTQNGLYEYEKTCELNVPVSLPIPQDYTGPDAWGYYAYANGDTFYDETPEYSWVELYGTGTPINVPTGDYTETVTLPFTFTYYGQDYSQVRVSTDGWLALGNGNQVAPENAALPHLDDVAGMAGVFWDDLYEDIIEEGRILYYHDAVNHRFIVAYDSISHNDTNNEPRREVFQVILLDPAHYVTATGDGEIIFQYKEVKQTDSMTIGIEDDTQQIGLQYVFDNTYDATAAEITAGTALKFTTDPPCISLITGVEENPENGNGSTDGGLVLEQNQPNPFRSVTRIQYALPKATRARIDIYDNLGNHIRTLQNGLQQAGRHAVEWNGADETGRQVSPGLYLYRLQADGHIKTRKLFRVNN